MPATVAHVFTNNVPNATGTVTYFDFAAPGSTNTVPATSIVRPTDWNETHLVTLAPTGAEMLGGFSNGGNVSFGTNPSGFITASAPSGGAGGIANAAGTQTGTSGTIVFSNSNNITFGMNNSSVITASASFNQSVQPAVQSLNGSSGAISLNVGSSLSASTNGSSITFGLASNITTALQSAGAYLTTAAQSNHSHNFATTTTGGSNIVVGTTNSAGATIGVPAYLTTAMQSNAATISNIRVSAGTTSNLLSAFTFSNGSGVSFGLNGSVITASVAAAGGAQTGVSGISAGTTQATSGTVSFANGNGVTFGMDGNTMTASVAAAGGAQTAISGLVVSNTTYTSGTVSFRDGNNISFASGTGQAVSITHNLQSAGAYLTTARASNDAIGLNTALTANGVSVTANSSGLSLNFPAFLTTAAQSSASNVSGIVAGTASNGGTATLSGNVSFSNANGISFFTSAGNAVVATVRTDYQSAGAYLTTAMQSNAVTLSNIRISGGTTSNLLSAITFDNANGISFGLNAGTMTASHNGLTTAAASNHSHGNPTLALTNLSGTTASNSAGLTLSLSAAAAGAANINFSAGTTSGNIGSVVFSNSNGVSFGLNGSTITASAAGGGGAFSAGISTSGNTSGTTGLANAQMVFVGGNNITLSQNTGAGGSNTIVISAAQGGIAAGTQTATSGTLVFANSNGVTFGMSGSSQITASYIDGGAVTISNWEPYPPIGGGVAFSTMGQNTIYLQRLQPPVNVGFSNVERRMSGSFVSSTNSQAATHTYHYGLYSRGTGASTSIYSQIGSSQLVFMASISSNVSAGITISQGAGSFTSTSAGTALMSLITGYKHLYMDYTGTITAGGEYAWAMRMSSATAVGTNALRIGLQELSVINNLTIGRIFASSAFASNASYVGDFAQGVYSATSSNLPATIARSGLTNAVSQQRMYLQFDN